MVVSQEEFHSGNFMTIANEKIGVSAIGSLAFDRSLANYYCRD